MELCVKGLIFEIPSNTRKTIPVFVLVKIANGDIYLDKPLHNKDDNYRVERWMSVKEFERYIVIDNYYIIRYHPNIKDYNLLDMLNSPDKDARKLGLEIIKNM